jgi:hypothetical protein
MELDGVNWIYLARDGNQWQAVVKMVINPRVPFT